MNTKLLLGMTLAIVGVVGNAQAITIRGTPTCAEWVKDQSPRDRTWFLGYLSGIAYARNKELLKGIENNSLYFWMDKYCNTNPLRMVSEGAEILAAELIQQKGL